MPFKVETGLLNPDTAQYAGKGQAKPTIADVAAVNTYKIGRASCRERV